MINRRQNFRLHKQLDVVWSVPDQKIKGKGVIFNLSLRGMLFETEKLFKPEHGLIINFQTPQVPDFPAEGKLVWFRKVGPKQTHYQCGVKFLKETGRTHLWSKWMEDNILKLADAQDNAILSRYLQEEQP